MTRSRTAAVPQPEAGHAMLRRVLVVLAPDRAKIIVVLAMVVASAGLTAITPFVIRAVFDRALFTGHGVDLHLLSWLSGGLIVIAAVSTVLSMIKTWLTAVVGNSAMARVRYQLFAHLHTLDLGFFTAARTGEIQSRLANDVGGVRTVLTDTISVVLQNIVVVAAAAVSMVIMSWPLALLTFGLMPWFVWMQVRVGQRRQRLARQTQESLSELTVITEESLSISGVLLAKVYDRSDDEVERYRLANVEQTELQVQKAMIGKKFFAIVQTTFAVIPALIYVAAGLLMTGRGVHVTAGTMVAFTAVQGRLQKPMVALMRKILDLHISVALFQRIFDYLDLRPAVAEPADPTVLPAVSAGCQVSLSGAWFRYPAGASGGPNTRASRFGGAVPAPRQDRSTDPVAQWAVRDLSLTVASGQFAAIVGPSGSGKTTLSYLLTRLYDVTEGAVRIDGHDVRELSRSSLTTAVGLVTQEPYLFHGTLRDNIAYARPGASDADVVEAARGANIHNRICSLTDGYDTLTGERGYRLSGGERQRLAIARVLLKNPRLMILDEATSALDTRTERLVQEAIERASQHRTTIAIAHRLSTICSADVIFVMEHGQLVERGTHEQLLNLGGLYAQLWAGQSEPQPPSPSSSTNETVSIGRRHDGGQFTEGSMPWACLARRRADVFTAA